jgi:hypothetical protein
MDKYEDELLRRVYQFIIEEKISKSKSSELCLQGITWLLGQLGANMGVDSQIFSGSPFSPAIHGYIATLTEGDDYNGELLLENPRHNQVISIVKEMALLNPFKDSTTVEGKSRWIDLLATISYVSLWLHQDYTEEGLAKFILKCKVGVSKEDVIKAIDVLTDAPKKISFDSFNLLSYGFLEYQKCQKKSRIE